MSGRADPPLDSVPERTSAGARGPAPLGRRAFIAGAAGAVVGVAAAGSRVHAVEPGASFFEVQTARRLADTRPGGVGYQRLGNNTIRVKVGGNGGIPSDAVAAVFTLTCVNNVTTGNYATAFPSGTALPNTSNLNFNVGENTLANLVTVKLGAGALKGFVDIFTFAPCDVLVDIAGVYRPTSSAVAAGRLVTLPKMERVLDTRSFGQVKPVAGSITDVNLNGFVPSDAIAVVANLTAVAVDGTGYLTAYENDRSTPPNASNLNVVRGDVRAVGIVTKLGTSGGRRGFKIFTFSTTHILVDVVGFITGPSGSDGTGGSGTSDEGLFVPINPFRALDTRADQRRLWPGWTRAFTIPFPWWSKARALAMNLTAVSAMGAGFFTTYAAQRQRYEVSNLNVVRSGQTVANHVITSVSWDGVATYSQSGAHVLADVTGWFTGGAEARQFASPPADPPAPPAPLPWTIQVDKMGLVNSVIGGAADPIVDSGNTWHWTGTGLVGQVGARIAVFGHRTEAGGPYRFQEGLNPGDRLLIWTGDNRLYEYEYASKDLASKFSTDILNKAQAVGGDTFSLVACTVGHDRSKSAWPNIWAPTSLEWRIVSRFRLVKWTDLG